MINKKQIRYTLKQIYQKDNDNVIFDRVSKTATLNGLLFDGIFVCIFFLLPIILASIGDLTSLKSNSTLYIVNFTLLAAIYPIGIFIYWRFNYISLIRNGGVGFFVAVIIMNLLIPIIDLILDETIANRNTIETISTIINDISKIIIIIVVLKIAYPLQMDIKNAIFKNFLVLIAIVIFGSTLFFAINPLFRFINLELNKSISELPNQIKVLNGYLDDGSFLTYWTIFFSITIAPFFYNLVYRHSIMVLMKTDSMKFIMPCLYFIVVFLINKQIEQQLTYFFYYFWLSILLTSIMYIKRNVAYSIFTNNLIALINIFIKVI